MFILTSVITVFLIINYVFWNINSQKRLTLNNSDNY